MNEKALLNIIEEQQKTINNLTALIETLSQKDINYMPYTPNKPYSPIDNNWWRDSVMYTTC